MNRARPLSSPTLHFPNRAVKRRILGENLAIVSLEGGATRGSGYYFDSVMTCR
jgi:hypothetical protein